MAQVHVTHKANKQLLKAPHHVQNKFRGWRDAVRTVGLLSVRRSAGFHDEPLKGDRQGQRSIRLNKQWRAIYQEMNGVLEVIVLEVTPHDY